jgi:hypothetical protein
MENRPEATGTREVLLLRRDDADHLSALDGKETSGCAHHGDKFAGEGLQNIDEDDDMLSAMARELVERNGIGESANAVWKALNVEHQKLFPATDAANAGSRPEPPDLVTTRSDAADLVREALDTGSLLILGRRVGSPTGRKRRSTVPEQASLFSLG